MNLSAEDVRLVLIESKADEALALAKAARRYARQARLWLFLLCAALACYAIPK